MVRQLSSPFATTLDDGPRALMPLETYVQLQVRNPTERLPGITDALSPSMYSGCKGRPKNGQKLDVGDPNHEDLPRQGLAPFGLVG